MAIESCKFILLNINATARPDQQPTLGRINRRGEQLLLIFRMMAAVNHKFTADRQAVVGGYRISPTRCWSWWCWPRPEQNAMQCNTV